MLKCYNIAQELLPVSDVLEKALESVTRDECSNNDSLAKLYEGVSLTYNQLHQVHTLLSTKLISLA